MNVRVGEELVDGMQDVGQVHALPVGKRSGREHMPLDHYSRVERGPQARHAQ